MFDDNDVDRLRARVSNGDALQDGWIVTSSQAQCNERMASRTVHGASSGRFESSEPLHVLQLTAPVADRRQAQSRDPCGSVAEFLRVQRPAHGDAVCPFVPGAPLRGSGSVRSAGTVSPLPSRPIHRKGAKKGQCVRKRDQAAAKWGTSAHRVTIAPNGGHATKASVRPRALDSAAAAHSLDAVAARLDGLR